jgi:hypothetical protein
MSVRRLSAVAGAILVVASGVAVVSPAYADVTQTVSCTDGGFTGSFRVRSSMTQGAGTVYELEYKINKGSQSGGNNANVYWNDGGVQPTLVATTTTGIQDNAWHTLRSANYSRGVGGNSFKFIFDKSNAGDPDCTKYGPL